MKQVNGVWEVTCPAYGDTLRFFSRNVAQWYLDLCADVVAQREMRMGKRS